jgi:hypothetical protein
MPLNPTPGKGISPRGLDKDEGWGTRSATTGQVIDFAHNGQQGINRTAGLSKSGLDTSTNPNVTSHVVNPIGPTSATVTWTTLTGLPAGSVDYRLAGTSAWTTIAETAGTYTNHSRALTGLTAGKWYEYVVTQPGATGAVTPTLFSGSFLTPLTMLLSVEQQTVVPPAFHDTTTTHDSQDLMADAFDLNSLEVDEVGPRRAVILWRTSVYADGTVMLRSGEDDPITLDEPGAKRRNHAVVLEDLAPDTHYEVAVLSADAEGNTVDGGPLGFNTPAR